MSLWARHGEGSHTVDTPWRLALYQVWEIILFKLQYWSEGGVVAAETVWHKSGLTKGEKNEKILVGAVVGCGIA